MNARQRRGVILLLLSVLCAAGVFAGVLAVIDDVESKVGPESTAYELKADLPAYQALDPGEFAKVSMPKRWLPSTAVTDLSTIRGKVAVTPLRKGSLLQTDMMADQPALKPGQQEIAIMIDAETGVAGKITPGSRVNIYATFDAKQQGQEPESRVIVSDAQVIDVGKITALNPDNNDNSDVSSATHAVPITFALDTEDAQRVAYAESFAAHVRLALLAPGDHSSVPQSQRTYTLQGDK
jgi:pilus assembly protein CpaB